MSRVKLDLIVKNIEYVNIMCYNLLWRNKMGIIELDNGYYIELIEDGKCKDDRIQNIQIIKLRESRNKGCLLL